MDISFCPKLESTFCGYRGTTCCCLKLEIFTVQKNTKQRWKMSSLNYTFSKCHYPKKERKTKLGISATGTEQTEENILPDLKTGLAPETHKCYVTADYTDSHTLSSTFTANSFFVFKPLLICTVVPESFFDHSAENVLFWLLHFMLEILIFISFFDQ